MQEITTLEQFNEITGTEKSVVIKFFAGWCPDCTRMDMFIDPIIEEYNSYTWYSMNRDNFPEIAEKYQVMGIPSLLIFQMDHGITFQTIPIAIVIHRPVQCISINPQIL